ncbi:bifunctional glycosyltransferase family 2/GtrA family protein [candidate division WWE3 bacterium]|uniref:Bifunctional glycosyltransferase family 2/GtrA family protein n=1 Tax=candidate division WWE3 bacterium TaxID=2053526 RepID=A0A955LJX4_UNCKA|nr:bifunctional glycosyltransferase family 2/GtrA family protein [candidate division WWE3 bacterium]
MRLSSLTIFFPAYNEEANIKKAVEQAAEVASAVSDDYEVLVVNDGSSDNTAGVVESLSNLNPRIKLITHGQNQGYGGALMTGFSNASKEWVFFSDSDLQFDLKELSKLVEKTGEFDVVLGYRIKRSDPFLRLLNAKGWNVLNRLLFGLDVKDIDCAFKLFRTSVVKEVVNDMTAVKGAMISAELLIRLQRANHQFCEVGVNHYPRKAGSPTGAKPSVILRAFKEMAMVYRGDLGKDWVKSTVKFMIVGGFNTLIDIALYVAFTRGIGYFGMHRMWAKGASYSIGALNSMVWNRAIRSSKDAVLLANVLPMFIVFMSSLLVNTTVMYVAYESFRLGEIFALTLATVTTLVWNFAASKMIKKA